MEQEKEKITDLAAEFERHEGISHKFVGITNPPSQRPDLCALLLLDALLPSTERQWILSSAEHDQVWFDVDCDDLVKVISSEQVEYLVRCGIFFDNEFGCLSMFV